MGMNPTTTRGNANAKGPVKRMPQQAARQASCTAVYRWILCHGNPRYDDVADSGGGVGNSAGCVKSRTHRSTNWLPVKGRIPCSPTNVRIPFTTPTGQCSRTDGNTNARKHIV
mmetsp:Transcript_19547/g.35164  ORF Transcript_19547/g.35164 Transcript_19547/m.35164 type:complete len:113 (-) Transcript_19547:566-904(-)